MVEVTTPGDEIDEGLAELNQKKQDKAGGLLPYRRSLWSLPGEALFMAPGEVFDLWELYLSAHGKNRGEEGV